MSESILRVEEESGVTVVSFPEQTEFSSGVVDQAGPELYALVEGEHPRNVVVDFANLTFLSSQGIGALLTLRLKAARTGSEIVLAGVPAQFDEIFRLTNFEQLYQVFNSVADAKTHFAATT